MKFGRYLDSHALPVWRSKYINYKFLKKKIKEIHIARGLEQEHERTAGPEGASEASVLLGPHGPTKYVEARGQRWPHAVERAEEAFLRRLDVELRKTDRHFCNELEKAQGTFRELCAQVDELGLRNIHQVVTVPQTHGSWGSLSDSYDSDFAHEEGQLGGLLHDDQRFAYAVSQLKYGFQEFYRHLMNVRSYQVLNHTACVKIVKKHDKNNATKLQGTSSALVFQYSFLSSNELNVLMDNVEAMYADVFFQGDRKQALKRLALRKLPSHKQVPVWRIFRLGLYIGVIMMACIACVLDGIARMHQHYHPWHNRSSWIMFRGLLVPCLMTWLCAINVYVFNRMGINHQYVFELHPTKHLTFLDLFELTAAFSMIVALAVLLYLSNYVPQGHEHLVPLAAYAVLVALLLNPLHIMHRSARWWLLRVFARVVMAPFAAVNFADFWLADQFCSLSTMFLDLEFTLCHYVHCALYPDDLTSALCSDPRSKVRAVLYLLPAWLRLAQCLRRYRDTGLAMPHLVNAGKYLACLVQTACFLLANLDPLGPPWTPARLAWIAASIVQTAYTLAYDVRMDWGLLWPPTAKHLRATRVYPPQVYYAACVLDLLMRCAWLLRLVHFAGAGINKSAGFLFALVLIELLRRFMWNFLRIETEYIADVRQFHALLAEAGLVRETVPAAPPDAETYAASRAEHQQEHGLQPP